MQLEMASYLLFLVLFLVLISFSGAAVGSQTTVDCSGQAQTMMPCFAYIGGEPSEPSPECCTALRTSDSTCTCTLLSLLATAVNQNNSLLLPTQCGIQNLTPDECKAVATGAAGAGGGAAADVAPSMAPTAGSRPPSSTSGSSSTPSTVLGASSGSTMLFLVPRVAMMLLASLLSLAVALSFQF